MMINDIQYYLAMFRDDMMNEILNAPADESTIDYLSERLKVSYVTVLEAALNRTK